MLKKKLEFSKDIFASKMFVYFDVMYVYVREMCERDVCVIRKVSDEYGNLIKIDRTNSDPNVYSSTLHR